jgi:PAS domain-containing protein
VVEVAVLDGDGVITSVNPAWTEFCTANGGDLARAGVGTSFLDVCAQASGDPWADLVASLVRLAVAGELPAPALLTVPCHSPDTSRWFDMTVASRHDDDGRCCGAKVTLTRTSVH